MEIDQQLQRMIAQIITDYQATPVRDERVPFALDAMMEKARYARKNLLKLSLKQREQLIQSIREQMLALAPALLKKLIEQTNMGCLDDKLISLNLIVQNTPALEDLSASVNTGDNGLTLNEFSPYGVIAAFVPLNNLIETMICNTIGMLAAGNAVIFAVPAAAYTIAQELVIQLNLAVTKAGGPEHLIGVVTDKQAKELVNHHDIDMVVMTGDAYYDLNIPICKKIILTGVAHTPVIVDETADVAQAAKDIVAGASFDHNLSFIAEKVIVAVDSVTDFLTHHLITAGAYVLTEENALKRLESLLLYSDEDSSAYKGRSAVDILYLLGVHDRLDTRLIVVEVDSINHPFVQNNLMAPILPLVRAKNVHVAIEMAKQIEGGCKHTAVMHSKHIDHLTACARELQVILFVKNAPSYAGLGLGGEGYTSFTIAAITGEGAVSARHYSRARRCVLSEGFLIK